jgi:tRNA (cytidine/uridine-2'-O-)-methyltransferase
VKSVHIVLVEPEIPGNTGNISRLCAAEHLSLHLVKPLGFSLDDRHMKRAGLDYWSFLDVHVHENYGELVKFLEGHRFFYNTTKARKSYTDVTFCTEDVLVFGKETKGLPESLLLQHEESCIRIPMVEEARSLNLSNAVAIVAMEALRQTGFSHLQKSNDRLFGKGTDSHEYL